MHDTSPVPFESARVEVDVVVALRDCLIRDSSDITDLSFLLTRALIASGDSSAALARLESLFAHAYNRLTAIKYDRLLRSYATPV